MILVSRAHRHRAGWLRGAGVAAALLIAAGVGAGCAGKSGDSASVASMPSSSAPSTDAKASSTGGGDLVAYTKCLRANGLPDFPDPSADGTLALPQGIDPNSKAFKDAEAKCVQYKPPGQPQQGGSADATWSQNDKLKYAKCMRDNGATGFSDPDASGNFSYRKGDGPDPDSPQYKAAEEACKKYKGNVPEGAQVGGNH